MATLKIKWKAKAKGNLEISLDDLELTIEEWDSLTDDEKVQIAKDVVEQDDETIVYGILQSFEVIDED